MPKKVPEDQPLHVANIHLNGKGDSDCPTLPTTMPRATDSSAITKKTNFRVYSHNVNGLRDESKLEFIPRMMQQQNIDAYLIQETHLSGDFEKHLINDYYIIHHGPEKQPNSGAKGGVAIILSPQMALQWKTSNIKENKKIVGGISVGNTTRLLSITIRFETINQQQDKKEKKKYHNLCLTSIYFPHSGYKEAELEIFNSQATDFLSKILAKNNTTHIIGADINSSIGTKKSLENENVQEKVESPLDIDPAQQLLGPFGNPNKSKSSDRILNLMREFQLRAASTFYDNNRKYNTWLGLPNATTKKRQAYQIDHIFIPKYQLNKTSNVKRKFNGTHSDHAALLIEFQLASDSVIKNPKKDRSANSEPPKKIDNAILRKKEKENFKKKISDFLNNLTPDDLNLLSTNDLLNKFEEYVVETATELAEREIKKRPDWFSESEDLLIELIGIRNNAFKKCLKCPSEENTKKLRDARHHLLREKRRAKRKWQYQYAEKCKKKDFILNPKEAWNMVFKLMEGYQKHHRNILPKNFKSKAGIEAKNDADNATILNEHFHSLFNSQVQIDITVLDELKQHETIHELGNPPSFNEVKSAINSMKYDKAPGLSGLTTDMMKSLPNKAVQLYTDMINNFWNNEQVDFEAWHITVLNTIYKGKGDPQDPNNHRGIALKETSAKVLSIILARRLLKRFNQLAPESQFGHIGCQEAQHILKRALLLRRQHGLESYAVFVDLVKAFDTVHHDLLCQILAKYGLPPLLVQTVKKLYKNCKVKIRVGKTFAEADYTTGVHQGDNMSPVLFLFVIQAFLDTLKLSSNPINFSHFPENKNGNLDTIKGRLVSQNTTAKGTPFSFNSSFYVDDSFFVFETIQELRQAIIELNQHFSRFGLIMHLGSETSKSKSEAMFFPNSLKQARINYDNDILPNYLQLPNNKKVHFVKNFKYLGSVITPLLNEDAEIDIRIKKAKSIMGASKHFFDNKDIDKKIKAEIYIAGPLNALLWGCEAWNLTKNNLKKIMSFHHSAIRRILNIRWDQVREKHIKNREVRGLLCNIPNIDAYINKRTATYIGKISRSNPKTYPKKFLTAWIHGKRKNGHPQLTCNNNYARVIEKIMPNDKPLINKQAPLKEWLPIAVIENNWMECIDTYFNSCRNIINLDELNPENVDEPENEPENEPEETDPGGVHRTPPSASPSLLPPPTTAEP